jgi:AcrR family transcriptional regulator
MRKTPRQQRSRAMVEAIVEAAARVLARRGWAGFTTNEVASVAGVSIGSLYQYFPNKLALAEAIRKQHLDAVLSALGDPAKGKSGTIPLEHRVTRLIDGVIAAHSVDPTLHKVLLDEVPFAPRNDQDDFEREYLARYGALVPRSARRRDASRVALAGRVLASAVEGVIHAAARRNELDSPHLKRELNDLVCAYLLAR